VEFSPDTNYLVIKGRFKATASSSYGLFIVFMDNVTKNVDKIEIVASHFSTVYDTNINMPWSELQDIITKLRWKGEYATSLTHDIQSSLEDLFQPGTGRGIDIWNAIKKTMVNKAANFFEEFFARPTGDKGVKVELAIETITKSDIENVKKMREQRDILNSLNLQNNQPKPQQAEQKLEESAVVLDVSLVLSPISGVPIYELKEGTKIFIKITEQTSRGQYFNDLLGASEGNEILPVPATVKKVSKEGKIYTVLVEIGPGIYGKSLDEDTVKVKLYDSNQDKRKLQKTIEAAPTSIEPLSETPPSSSNGSFLFWVMGGIGLLIIMILVYLGLGL